MNPYPPLPDNIEEKLARARKLEWWTLFWLALIVFAMFLVMGGSQAMRAAWIEDMLSLIPPILFLIAVWVERLPPSEKFPFGLHRMGTLAFTLAAAALTVMGGFLVYDAGMTFILQEHPTIGTMSVFGEQVWMGWIMVGVLFLSIIPPVILGRKKRRIARELKDKVLFTDADMNAADWKTGAAGIIGIIGIAFGFWWADAAAAGLIGLDILKDGLRSLRISVAELLDGAPRTLQGDGLEEIVKQVENTLGAKDDVRIREAGRYLHVVVGNQETLRPDSGEADKVFGSEAWRVVTFAKAPSARTKRQSDA